MAEKDFIKELFADKLANAEAPVNPELWNAISAKIATQTAVSAGLSTTAKLIIGLGTAATITVASVLYLNREEQQPKTENKEQVSYNAQPKENKVQENDKVSETPNEVAKTAASRAISAEEIHFIEPDSYADEQQNQDVIGFGGTENAGDSDKNDQQKEEALPVSKTADKQNTAAEKTVKPLTQEKGPEQSVLEIGELPNIFTPNNDNENDYFFIPVKGVQDFVLTILDQNNETVFRTTDPNFKWDGRDAQGNLVPSGTKFVYFFTGKGSHSEPVSRYNHLEIRY
ncbi:MAG: hypothetical protein K0R65_2859 [Crocinitomicaceae bacterium]|jgi:gliding motility-associated-like protein|nr:hypothetical protein [Crocinitomicaceae bacterium]